MRTAITLLAVARYFRVALRDGQPIVTRARVAWRGEFNTGQLLGIEYELASP